MHEILSSNGLEHILLAGFLHLSPKHELIQHEEGFLKVEDDVQLTHLWNRNCKCSQINSQALSAHFQDSIQNTVSTVPRQYPKYCQHSSKTVSKIILKQLTVSTVQETSNVLSQLSITINIALTSLRQHQKCS